MSKEINIFKVSNYDKFKCIADKCKFTCCVGWDINIDTNTYDKWTKVNDDSEYLLSNVKLKQCENKDMYFINKENHEACPFLDKQGLCYVVKNHGEEYLSSTCHMFPRIENVFDNRKEFSLSCSCPEVVEIISNMYGKIKIYSENNTNFEIDLLELKIREVLINIIQKENLGLQYKLIIGFEMLLSILENENFNREDILLEELEKYKDIDYIKNLASAYREIELNIYDSIEEINNLFLDIIENYKEVSMFDNLLSDISSFAEDAEIESLSAKWDAYNELFNKYNDLIENCIVSKVLSNCVSNDIEYMIISYQMIVLDYLLVRYALFLKYCMNEEKLNIEDIKDYIVAFSRIIGNNTEAVKEFLEDGFGDTILELGYLCFISLF
ncbi:lysine-N-methylase [Clostridium baratii]|uniref:FliB family protein n=1 Tax=Clostridium baratii TaxID=1561 RepID=A0A174U6X9_9CLOT|nr:flagellin lysine-N-methylase [Clostridium baratii]OPF52134.1 lysine-N-methylase [Clostridium baratii]OPF54279.1 lysine-N-methylase [Clostridium baratii]OPF54937.1 lysine-N-methylase [Clostridium baratii]OPF59185.1 lysine-N-methylase [Clostridium baratii]CUQ16461.1 FliB family protein [Clostridium baratii]